MILGVIPEPQHINKIHTLCSTFKVKRINTKEHKFNNYSSPGTLFQLSLNSSSPFEFGLGFDNI